MRSRVARQVARWLASVVLAVPLAAQAAVCADLLWGYETPLARSETSLDLIAPGSGRLTYRGAYHSRDPRHPQFGPLLEDWRNATPTLAFYEGPERPPNDAVGDAIRNAGESGLVRHLAQRDGVRQARLEQNPAKLDEVNEMLGKLRESWAAIADHE